MFSVNRFNFRLLLVLIVPVMMLVFLPTSVLAQMDGFSSVDDYAVWSLDEYESAGGSIDTFSEAPMLTELVEAGELPPVEERLPVREDVLVVQPREAIGEYGGEISFNATNPISFGNTGFTAWDQHLTGLSTNWEVVFPVIAKSLEFSSDFTELTITLRRGMKWSDGEPFTTDDIMFWYEDIMLHPELPNLPSQLAPNGEPVEIEQVDDTTVIFRFAQPYPAITTIFAAEGGVGFPMAPRHYLEQWHADYNPNAQALAEEEGFDTWISAFEFHYDGQTGQEDFDPDMPVLKPWVLDSVDTFGNKFYVRNPYYFKVDTQGNQLPYIDRQVRRLLTDPEVVILNAQSGDLDYGYYNLEVRDLPVLVAGEEDGDYTTLLWPADQGAMNKLVFNLTTNDEVLAEIFNDIRFRQAMSVAIDRAEINETLYFGLAKERQWGVSSASPFYEDWMGDYYAQYDPELANQLLDEMGLERGDDGVRLRPDGERLSIVLWDAINQIQQTELVAEYWEAVGVDVEINPSTREAFQDANLAHETEASIWFADVVAESEIYIRPFFFRPPYSGTGNPHVGGLEWWEWYTSGGEEGVEPEDPFHIQQMELADAFQLTERGSDEYYELGTQLVSGVVEKLIHIGIVGEAPEVFIRSNRLQNFPPEEGTLYINHLRSGHADQWYVTE